METQQDDIQRLFELLRNPQTNGLQKEMHEQLLRQQFEYQNSLLKWGFGILSALVVAGVTAAVNDHFTLKDLAETVNLNKKRVEIMWYGQRYNEKFPNIIEK